MYQIGLSVYWSVKMKTSKTNFEMQSNHDLPEGSMLRCATNISKLLNLLRIISFNFDLLDNILNNFNFQSK